MEQIELLVGYGDWNWNVKGMFRWTYLSVWTLKIHILSGVQRFIKEELEEDQNMNGHLNIFRITPLHSIGLYAISLALFIK